MCCLLPFMFLPLPALLTFYIALHPTHDVLHTVPPKISHFEFSKELNVGDRTSIQCVAGTGDLPLVFTWLKDNVPIKQSGAVGANDNINSDSRYNSDKRLNNKDGTDDNNSITIRQNDEFTSALSINSIRQSHAGQYACRVQNDAAVVQYSAILKVNGINKQRKIFLFYVFFTFTNLRSMLLIIFFISVCKLTVSTCRMCFFLFSFSSKILCLF